MKPQNPIKRFLYLGFFVLFFLCSQTVFASSVNPLESLMSTWASYVSPVKKTSTSKSPLVNINNDVSSDSQNYSFPKNDTNIIPEPPSSFEPNTSVITQPITNAKIISALRTLILNDNLPEDIKNFFRGPQGPVGPVGPQGPTGPTGNSSGGGGYTFSSTPTPVVNNPGSVGILGGFASLGVQDLNTKTFAVSGDSTLQGSLSVNGNSTLKNISSTGTLDVTGDSSLTGALSVTGNTTISGTLSFSGTDTGGLKLKSLTTVQRDALTPSAGILLFNTTTSKMQLYNGSTWKNIGNPEIGGEVTNGTTGSVLFLDSSGLQQDNSNFFWDNTNNRLGIGTSSPTANLHIVGSGTGNTATLFGGSTTVVPIAFVDANTTSTSDRTIGSYTKLVADYSGANTSIKTGVQGVVEVPSTNSQDSNRDIRGVYGVADYYGTGTTSGVTGGLFLADVESTGGVTTALGASGTVYVDGASAIGSMIGLQAYTQTFTAGSHVSAAYGLHVQGVNTGGTIDNGYGVYIDSIAGTNAWGLYQASSGLKNYFAGSIGIGTTSPQTALEINGGSSSLYERLVGTTQTQEIAYRLADGTNEWYTGLMGSTCASGSYAIYRSGCLMTINPSGYVGIGTTNPLGILHIKTAAAPSATGGTITQSGGYTIHTFTSSGTFHPNGARNVEYLIVGGGGGGGWGGGGAGGVRQSSAYQVSAQDYTVTVGAGGAVATNGGSSAFGSIVVAGGGKGGSGGVAGSGGSGGGTSDSTAGYATDAPSLGYNGTDRDACNCTGGGGGAGGSGTLSNGGVGISSSISGSATYYAGGGGGGNSGGSGGTGGTGGGGNGGNSVTSGTANTGGGGGGYWGNSALAGTGGSGIVIIRYLTAPTVDSLFVDSTDGNVGIGTTTPTAKLDVNGNVNVSGKVTSSSGMVLLKKGFLTKVASTGQNTIFDSVPISGLTTSDKLMIVWSSEGSTGITDLRPYNLTDGTSITSTGTNAEQIGSIVVGYGSSATRWIYSGVIAGVATPASPAVAMSTAWTGNWTLALKDVGGSGGNSTQNATWSVYKIVGSADLAERYPSDEILESGDVVAFSTTGDKKLEKATSESKTLAGIISTAPGITLGDGMGSSLGNDGLVFGQKAANESPLALAGRIPVKISLENGPIIAGDRLTVSETLPGYAMRMTGPGQSIGIALENSSQEKDTILVFANLGYQDNHALEDLELRIDGLEERIAALEGDTGSNGGILATLGQYAVDFFTNGIKSVTDGVVYMRNIVIEKLTVGSSEKPAGIQMFDPNGSPYCVRVMVGGVLASEPGTCDPVPEVVPDPAPETTPTEEVTTDPVPDPTCTDGIQNQDETGIDEGGVCTPSPEVAPDTNPEENPAP